MFEQFMKKEGFVIAIGTMVLYAATYFFERGYCLELGIPLDYIQITIPTIANDFIYFYLFLLPIAFISTSIILRAEDKTNKKLHSIAQLLCGLIYAVLLFYYVEKTLQSAFFCLLMGGLYSVLISSRTDFKTSDSPLKHFYSTLTLAAIALFILSLTFIAIGRSLAENGSFQTYSKDGKSYLLLKVYGEDVFMRELKNDKPKGDLIYFNTKDMTGMALKKNN
ncbi:TPA: hypothetical protein O7M03_000466 [Escherichia coli]|uniref:hypothetical protein n=1 Tax=Escherichia coli TaxID=562 RepID=UPI00237F174B|nr:hypothetical protein [Escherichia coli]EIL1426956.1 hypothetical protein [Escherichia coli]HDB9531517.1 hypothetical protein [Escherichia coli]